METEFRSLVLESESATLAADLRRLAEAERRGVGLERVRPLPTMRESEEGGEGSAGRADGRDADEAELSRESGSAAAILARARMAAAGLADPATRP